MQETQSEIVREWIKLTVGIGNLSEEMGKTRGTIHNYLKNGDIKKAHLIKILGAAANLGVEPSELNRLLTEIGQDPNSYNINKNIKNSTVITGNQNTQLRIRNGEQSENTRLNKDWKKKAEELQIELNELKIELERKDAQLELYEKLMNMKLREK